MTYIRQHTEPSLEELLDDPNSTIGVYSHGTDIRQVVAGCAECGARREAPGPGGIKWAFFDLLGDHRGACSMDHHQRLDEHIDDLILLMLQDYHEAPPHGETNTRLVVVWPIYLEGGEMLTSWWEDVRECPGGDTDERLRCVEDLRARGLKEAVAIMIQPEFVHRPLLSGRTEVVVLTPELVQRYTLRHSEVEAVVDGRVSFPAVARWERPHPLCRSLQGLLVTDPTSL